MIVIYSSLRFASLEAWTYQSQGKSRHLPSFCDRKPWDFVPTEQVALRPLEGGLIEKWYQYVSFVSNFLIIATLLTRFIVLVRVTGSYAGINGNMSSTIQGEMRKGMRLILNVCRKVYLPHLMLTTLWSLP